MASKENKSSPKFKDTLGWQRRSNLVHAKGAASVLGAAVDARPSPLCNDKRGLRQAPPNGCVPDVRVHTISLKHTHSQPGLQNRRPIPDQGSHFPAKRGTNPKGNPFENSFIPQLYICACCNFASLCTSPLRLLRAVASARHILTSRTPKERFQLWQCGRHAATNKARPLLPGAGRVFLEPCQMARGAWLSEEWVWVKMNHPKSGLRQFRPCVHLPGNPFCGDPNSLTTPAP